MKKPKHQKSTPGASAPFPPAASFQPITIPGSKDDPFSREFSPFYSADNKECELPYSEHIGHYCF